MTQFDLLTTALDITGAFTTATEKETLFVNVPWGILGTGPHEVCQLATGLYGSKHASIQFYEMLTEWLIGYGFKRLLKDLCVFIFQVESDCFLILAIYVSDILLFEQSIRWNPAWNPPSVAEQADFGES